MGLVDEVVVVVVVVVVQCSRVGFPAVPMIQSQRVRSDAVGAGVATHHHKTIRIRQYCNCTVLYRTVQILYSRTVKYGTSPCSTVQYSIVQYQYYRTVDVYYDLT